MLRRVLLGAALGATSLSQFSRGDSLAHQRRSKFIRIPSSQWDAEHEDINAHVKKRIPGETRVDRVKRFAREWRNVELELGLNKDSRGRELRYRKTFVFRYTYPNAFDDHWFQQR